ncbi:MAG: PulJ/GspJ family protein [Verrucomicrobiales bacterium]
MMNISSNLPKEQARKRVRTNASAFTMIEIILAIAIFSMVMIAIYSSWSAIMRGSRVGLTAAADVQRTRIAMRALKEALSSTVMYADNSKYYGFFADTGGQHAYLSFVARLPESFPGSGLFQGQSLRRVTFEVDQKGQFILTQAPLLEAFDKVQKPYTIVLAPKTSLFAAEFYDSRKNEWAPEWIYTNQLPKMARVAIAFGDKAAPSQLNSDVTLDVIPMNAVAITRSGAMAGQLSGGRTGAPGEIPAAGLEEVWQPNLPGSFGENRGNVQPNPVFPRSGF